MVNGWVIDTLDGRWMGFNRITIFIMFSNGFHTRTAFRAFTSKQYILDIGIAAYYLVLAILNWIELFPLSAWHTAHGIRHPNRIWWYIHSRLCAFDTQCINNFQTHLLQTPGLTINIMAISNLTLDMIVKLWVNYTMENTSPHQLPGCHIQIRLFIKCNSI